MITTIVEIDLNTDLDTVHHERKQKKIWHTYRKMLQSASHPTY